MHCRMRRSRDLEDNGSVSSQLIANIVDVHERSVTRKSEDSKRW